MVSEVGFDFYSVTISKLAMMSTKRREKTLTSGIKGAGGWTSSRFVQSFLVSWPTCAVSRGSWDTQYMVVCNEAGEQWMQGIHCLSWVQWTVRSSSPRRPISYRKAAQCKHNFEKWPGFRVLGPCTLDLFHMTSEGTWGPERSIFHGQK